MSEINFCPNCGKSTSDPEYAKKFSPYSALDWTGKVVCPFCNYSGFFLKLPEEEYSKMKFTPTDFPAQPAPTSSFEPGPEYWLVGLIGICILLALLWAFLGHI